MRRCYLVFYDIREPKRLRRVHRVLKGYGEAWQYSVFFCVLKDIDRVRLQTDLEGEMNQKEDQVMILDLGANEKRAQEAVTTIGLSLPERPSGILVI
jgi:CRISPR-associated protein Cas2